MMLICEGGGERGGGGGIGYPKKRLDGALPLCSILATAHTWALFRIYLVKGFYVVYTSC